MDSGKPYSLAVSKIPFGPINPNLIVKLVNRLKASITGEDFAGALRLVEDVAHAKHQFGVPPILAKRAKRRQKLAIDSGCSFIDNHQIGIEAKDRFLQDRFACLLYFFGAVGEIARRILFGCKPVHARKLDVINAFGNSKGMNHRRSCNDQDGSSWILCNEFLRKEQCPADVPHPERIVRIEHDLGRRTRSIQVRFLLASIRMSV